MSAPRLSIIGAGRAATSLARAWAAAGAVALGQVVTRSRAASGAAVAVLGGGRPAALRELTAADWWLIGVPDDAVSTVAEDLARRRVVRPADLCAHLSGALPARALAPLPGRHASVHPLRSFPAPEGDPRRLRGTCVGLEGETRACRELAAACEAAGLEVFTLPGEGKARYHAACSLASNYPVALAGQAERLFAAAGLEAALARRLTSDLLTGAARAVAALGPETALTGPVVRADGGTVARQLQALPQDQRRLFAELGLAAVALGEDAGRLGPEQARSLRALLDEARRGADSAAG